MNGITLRAAAFCAALTALAGAHAFAEAEPAPQSASGPVTAANLSVVASTIMEAKATLTGSVSIPCLAIPGPLTGGNNLTLTGGAELSPVSMNATVEARLTPLAFIQLVAAASAGSGWNIPIANGLRMNERSGEHDAELTGGPFEGMVWSVSGGGVFQFDLAALKPGDWNHVVFQTYQGAKYRALTSASAGESWLFEADQGENRNGWNYYGSWFLGYKMPTRVNLAGILAENERYLYDEKNGADWGDGLGRWKFAAVVNYATTERTGVALILQWRTMRTFTEETEDYGFYQDRVLADGSDRHLEFYRAALTVNVRLK